MEALLRLRRHLARHLAGTHPGGLLISTMVLLVIPLITAHFASELIVDRDAFQHEEQEELKNNLRVVRALLEQLAAAPPAGEPASGHAFAAGAVTSPGSVDPSGAR